MRFQIGDIIQVEQREYLVLGRITYQNVTDHCDWDEYRIQDRETKREAWLSVDYEYKEYSISWVTRQPSLEGYHEVDKGIEVVSGCAGSVDVESGDRANFIEYEDATEELIISQEIWSDGTEWSTGHYIDENEFAFVRKDEAFLKKQKAANASLVGIMVCFFVVPLLIGIISNIHIISTIQKHLNKSADYTYVTSVTGNEKQKAKVYKAKNGSTVDSVSRDIIDAIEGNTQYVQQDDSETEGAVAILTKKEYCIIYPALEQEGILVQVSNRKYAYTSDDDLYDGSETARRYYRRFYHSTGYLNDSRSYRSYSSPYSSYSDNDINYTGSDTYGSYSSSVRQSSIEARQSSGGGLSGGK